MKLNREEFKKWIIKNLRWIILFVCLISFLAIAEDVLEKEIMRGDIIGYKIISKYLISSSFTPIAKFITNLASGIFLIVLTILLLILIKNKKLGICIGSNLIIVTGLNLMLKNIVQRPRPTEYRLIDETGYSFPSGHSMVSMAFYGFLIYLICKYVKNKIIKNILIVILSLLIILIGVSRIYLGVHYTSDVFGGFLISMSYLIIFISIIKKFILDDIDINKSW